MMLYIVRAERHFVPENTEAGSKCVTDPVCITVSSSRCVCVLSLFLLAVSAVRR